MAAGPLPPDGMRLIANEFGRCIPVHKLPSDDDREDWLDYIKRTRKSEQSLAANNLKLQRVIENVQDKQC
jgi:hypothetical protein